MIAFRPVLFLNPKFTTEEAYPYVIPRGNPHIHRQ